MKTLPTGDYFLKNTSFLQFDCLNPHSSFSIYYNPQLSPGTTIQINQSETFQAINSLEISDLTVDGNGNTGGSAEIMARNSVTLKDGFWAKSGSTVHVHIGPFLTSCEIWPDVLFESKKVLQNTNITGEREIEIQFEMEASEGVIRVFPNPSEGTFVLALPEMHQNDHIQLSVFDCLGRLIFERSIKARIVIELDMKEYPSGSYYLIVQANGSYTDTESFCENIDHVHARYNSV